LEHCLIMPITINGSGTVTGILAGGLPDGTVTSDTLASSAIYLTSPAGAVCFVTQNSAPTGWLKANGAAISRTAYANLFAAIGTTFGVGNGSTTFTLPDLRGEFLRSWADGRGVDTGRSFGSFQDQAYLSHGHGVNDPGHSHSYARQDWGAGAQAGGSYTVGGPGFDGTGGSGTGISIQTSGGAETRPRNIALLACIKF
jgi:phage-related tail fiber protein